MAVKPKRLNVVLCWHMHQPHYRDILSGRYLLPWTYLHAMKDYTDMIAHLEATPQARVVINFAPTLLEQIDDYARQIGAFLKGEGHISDPLLAALASATLPQDPLDRAQLAEACTKANRERLIEPHPQYCQLVDTLTWLKTQPFGLGYQNDAFFTDLLTWFHLVWMGETVRRKDARIQQLFDQEKNFSLQDRRVLLTVIHELLSTVIKRYKHLAERGQIELSFTPYAHPIMPLLLDLHSAQEAQPDLPLPTHDSYPDGEARVNWHITKGFEVFKHYFACSPSGCWPSEGGLSHQTLQMFTAHAITWTATGETVLANTLQRAGHTCTTDDKDWLYRPYRQNDAGVCVFFRDDALSDAVGFNYATWHADDAVADLLHHLENIANSAGEEADQRVVSIILDGENAWEYYPANGYYFLQALYKRLSTHPKLNMTTFDACIDSIKPAALPKLVAGSWVYGNFSTWIGAPDKNRGWDMLIAAKQAFDQAIAHQQSDHAHLPEALQQLAICEGSDWCWWFGDYNPAGAVSDFEHLYRCHLTNLYNLIGVEPPDYLAQSFTYGGGEQAVGGTMRQGQEQKGAVP